MPLLDYRESNRPSDSRRFLNRVAPLVAFAMLWGVTARGQCAHCSTAQEPAATSDQHSHRLPSSVVADPRSPAAGRSS